MEVLQAIEILKQYSCITGKTEISPEERQQLKEAILLISRLADDQNLGICADNLDRGFSTLVNYLKALGYEYQTPSVNLEPSKGIYLKFNTEKLNHHIDVYEGDYRGVLISYRGEDPEIMGTYGYFPLDLFD